MIMRHSTEYKQQVESWRFYLQRGFPPPIHNGLECSNFPMAHPLRSACTRRAQQSVCLRAAINGCVEERGSRGRLERILKSTQMRIGKETYTP